MGQINDGPDKPFKIGKNSRFHPDNQGAGKWKPQKEKLEWLHEDNYPKLPRGCIIVPAILLVIIITLSICLS